MKRVLVTGASGFVGGHLIKELADHGTSVIATGTGELAASTASGANQYIRINLLDPAAVASLDLSTVDGVVHLAGLAAVGPSFEAPLTYVETNMGMEINLLEQALRQQARPRFLIISSGSLYDAAAPLPLTEISPIKPSSPYAVSKIGQEQLAQYYGSRGIPCLIARPFNHIGPGQGPGFILPDLTKQVVDYEAGRTPSITVGNLDSQRDYTDVRDIVRAYRLLLEQGQPEQIYNICSSKPVSGQELLNAILASSGAKPAIRKDPALLRPADSPVLYGDHQKLTRDTGWRPEIDLMTTIADVIADWRGRA